jgi:hypothetical protein
MAWTLQKNDTQQVAQTIAGGGRHLYGWKKSMLQWHREEWKDSGWTEYNGDWESEHISDVNKSIHTGITKQP